MSDRIHHPARQRSIAASFLKTTSALVGGAMLGVNAQIARSAHVYGSDEIKVAVVGCGGRGTGAATQALATKGKVKLWASGRCVRRPHRIVPQAGLSATSNAVNATATSCSRIRPSTCRKSGGSSASTPTSKR